MKISIWLIVASVLCLGPVKGEEPKSDQTSVQASVSGGKPPTFITFDAPGVVETVPYGINADGSITGETLDANLLHHGFLREKNGNIILFDVPGPVPSGQYVGTYPLAINDEGTITGWFLTDFRNATHGFLRDKNGTITLFDAPGSVSEGFTLPFDLNSAGTIAGFFGDENYVAHGFLRDKKGMFTKFDAPGAGTSGGPAGTRTQAINSEGAVAGFIWDDRIVGHGFLRDKNGMITTLDVPGAGGAAFQGTYGEGISADETIAGNLVDANNVAHVFLRDKKGVITRFDVPGAGTLDSQGTYVPDSHGINPGGDITGGYIDANNVNHGFVRDKKGNVTTFNVPGAGTDAYQGTFPTAINPAGAITGYYVDANNALHGFLLSR